MKAIFVNVVVVVVVFFVNSYTCFTKGVFLDYWSDQVYVKEYMHTNILPKHFQHCLHK